MPTLIFSPKAWLKLLYMKNSANTEVSGFGISKVDNPLYVEDFVTIKQECTAATTDMDEEALDKYLEEMEEVRGLPISSFYRIWIHTHPNMSPNPSGTDEENFSTMFKSCTWALMVIVGKDEEVYARLRLNRVDVVGKLEMELDAEVDWVSLYTDLHEEWTQELKRNVTKNVWQSPVNNNWWPHQNWGQQTWQGSVYSNQSAYGRQQTSLAEEYDEANRVILEELNKEQPNQKSETSSQMRFLKGKIKKILDRMDDFDRSVLIDEIDEFYELNYLTGAATSYDGITDSKDFSVEKFTGQGEESSE